MYNSIKAINLFLQSTYSVLLWTRGADNHLADQLTIRLMYRSLDSGSDRVVDGST